MTPAELDSDGTVFTELGKDGKPIGLTWRVKRVARGSGSSIREVEEVLSQYRMMANVAKQAGGKNGWYVINLLEFKYLHLSRLSAAQKMQAAAGGKGRGANGMPSPAQIQAMQVGLLSHASEIQILIALSARFTARNASKASFWRGNAGNDEGYPFFIN